MTDLHNISDVSNFHLPFCCPCRRLPQLAQTSVHHLQRNLHQTFISNCGVASQSSDIGARFTACRKLCKESHGKVAEYQFSLARYVSGKYHHPQLVIPRFGSGSTDKSISLSTCWASITRSATEIKPEGPGFIKRYASINMVFGKEIPSFAESHSFLIRLHL